MEIAPKSAILHLRRVKEMKQPITFISVTEHAKKQMDFYVDVFPNTTIQSVTYYDEYLERVLNGQLDLNGTLIYFLEMGPEAAGIFQKVTWLTDQFGVTWQFVFAGK